jgi:hypothetical protein
MDKEILELIKYGIWLVFGSGIVCEFAPIKFSPISLILSGLGKKLNKDIKDELSQVKNEVKSVSTDLQEHIVESQRRNILDFADDLMRGMPKTKENFTNIIYLHDKYNKFIEVNKLENGQVDLAFEYISQKYKECLAKNGFYTGK